MRALVLTHWMSEYNPHIGAALNRPAISHLVAACKDVTGQAMRGEKAIDALPLNALVVDITADDKQLAAVEAAGAIVLHRDGDEPLDTKKAVDLAAQLTAKGLPAEALVELKAGADARHIARDVAAKLRATADAKPAAEDATAEVIRGK